MSAAIRAGGPMETRSEQEVRPVVRGANLGDDGVNAGGEIPDGEAAEMRRSPGGSTGAGPSAGSAEGWRQSLSRDLLASIVVFLVAVPLSMGIALASGAPIPAGLIAAVVGGIVVGVAGGAPLQVSGPAAGLAVIVFGFIQQFGFKVTCLVTVAAGLLQITFGLLRVARLALAISPAVLHAMLAGIGIQIALSQLHVVLGGKPQSSAWNNVRELPSQVADLHGVATVLGLATIAVLIVWPAVKGLKKLHLPAPLVAVLGVTVVSELWDKEVPRVALPGGVLSSLQLPSLPDGQWGAVVVAVITLAIVASAESLLSAVATDKLHAGPRANLDRELIGQGLANSVSGLVGGLPITGVIVRSSANIEAGAKTRLSAILHGVWVLLAVAFAGALLTKIPLAVLAGLLVVVGVKLVNIGHIKALYKHKELSVYAATLAGVLGINLLAGIGIGFGVAVARLLWKLTRAKVEVTRTDEGRWLLHVTGSLTFLTVPTLSQALAKVPPGAQVDVDLDVTLVDHAAMEALHAFRESHKRTGGVVDIDQVHEAGRPTPQRAS
jgi:carbonic anhydrase